MKRRKKRNPGGFWAWASDHWIISGFILFPAALAIPVGIMSALSGTARAAVPTGPAAPPIVPGGSDVQVRRAAWRRRIIFLACIADAQGHPDQGDQFRLQAQLMGDGVTALPDFLPPPFVGTAGGCVE